MVTTKIRIDDDIEVEEILVPTTMAHHHEERASDTTTTTTTGGNTLKRVVSNNEDEYGKDGNVKKKKRMKSDNDNSTDDNINGVEKKDQQLLIDEITQVEVSDTRESPSTYTSSMSIFRQEEEEEEENPIINIDSSSSLPLLKAAAEEEKQSLLNDDDDDDEALCKRKTPPPTQPNASLSPVLPPLSSPPPPPPLSSSKKRQKTCNGEEHPPPAEAEAREAAAAAPPPPPTSNTKIRPDIFDAIMLGISSSSSRTSVKRIPDSVSHANRNNMLVASKLQEKGHSIARLMSHALDDDEDEDDTSVVSAATSRSFSSNSSSLSMNGPRLSEAGIIHRIEVENFMCHRKVVVDLSPNINFIYGQNGSGKSAILAAIQICLGVQARKTHRATNLKELIRHSASYAKLRVTLLNSDDEDDGYHYDTYGELITIERTIAGTAGGYNGYKIYDEYMNEKSRSKKDLDDLLDKLNIQVDNPVTIMDQESSKRFLLGKAQDKYTFFTRATELDRIQTSYEALIEQIDVLEKQSHIMRNCTLVKDKELVRKAKEKYEEHIKIEKLEHKLLKYEEMYSWAFLHESKELAEVETNNHNMLQQKAAKIESQFAQIDEDSMILDHVEEARRKLDTLSKEARNQSELKRDLEVKLKQAVEPQKAVERQLKLLQIKHNAAKHSLVKATKILHQKRDEIINAKEGEGESKMARLTKRLQDAEDKHGTLNEKRDRLKKEAASSTKQYDEIEPDVEQAKEKCRNAQKNLKILEERLKELRSSSTSNTMAVFGHKCPKVKQLVDEALSKSRFTGPVLGPIGRYIRVVRGKEKYAALAEFAIGNRTLDRWIVTNDHDRKMFQSIREHAGCQNDCGIFQVSQHSKYEIPPPPYDDVETVASVLQCSNDLVFNCLVDNKRIEEKALFSSKNASESTLLERGNDGQYSIGGRGHIKQVYFLPHGDSWSIRDGGISMMSNEKKLRQTFDIDKSIAVVQTEQDVRDAEVDLKNLQNEESVLNHTYLTIQKQVDKSKLDSQENKKELDRCAALIEVIRNEISSIDTSSGIDTDTSEFEEDVREACEQVKKLAEEDKQLRDQIDEQNPKIGEIKAQLEEARTRNAKVIDDITKAGDDLAKHLSDRTNREEKLQKKRDKLKQYQHSIEKQEKLVDDLQSTVNLNLDKARRKSFQRAQRDKHWISRENGEEQDSNNSQLVIEPTSEELGTIGVIDAGNTSSFFRAKIKRTEGMIQQEKVARGGIGNKEDRSIAHQKLLRAKKRYEDNKRTCRERERLAMILQEEATKRTERWKQLRSHISEVTARKFDEMLNKKGSSGSIEFDHDGGRLDLIVQKNSRDVNSQQRDVKALSGGERSFATIALLLALGESLETPFRVLDEFDVFLDPVARKVTIDSLVEMAKSMEHRQFIFITPQDVSFVDTDPMLKVLQMTPPARKN